MRKLIREELQNLEIPQAVIIKLEKIQGYIRKHKADEMKKKRRA
jgi:hypothetical protein